MAAGPASSAPDSRFRHTHVTPAASPSSSFTVTVGSVICIGPGCRNAIWRYRGTIARREALCSFFDHAGDTNRSCQRVCWRGVRRCSVGIRPLIFRAKATRRAKQPSQTPNKVLGNHRSKKPGPTPKALRPDLWSWIFWATCPPLFSSLL